MVEQIQDNFVIDQETGEVLQSLGKAPEWAPTTPDDFEAIGQWLSEYDGQLAGIEARRKFLNENLDTMARDVHRRKEGLLWKFRPLIEAHAKANLPKGKKTWTCPFMSVAFKSHGEDVSVEDKKAALEWAEEHAPEAIVQKPEFQITKMDPEKKAALVSQQGLDGVFKYRPAGESVTIKTSSGD